MPQLKQIPPECRKRIYDMYKNAERAPSGKIRREALAWIRRRFAVSNNSIYRIAKEFESLPVHPAQE